MAHLYTDVDEISPYLKARKRFYPPKDWDKMGNALRTSTTLYVGNLSFYTEEEQVCTLFSLCGPVRRIIMGINKFNKTPCGFAFVEYYFHKDAMAARDYINGTKLDERLIRVDIDPGFEPGRQYGRGQSGGQVRDDRRNEYDEGRGGLPPKQRRKVEEQAYQTGMSVVPPSQHHQNTRDTRDNRRHDKHERSNDNEFQNHNRRYDRNDRNNQGYRRNQGQNRRYDRDRSQYGGRSHSRGDDRGGGYHNNHNNNNNGNNRGYGGYNRNNDFNVAPPQSHGPPQSQHSNMMGMPGLPPPPNDEDHGYMHPPPNKRQKF